MCGIEASNLFEHVANLLLANREISYCDHNRRDYLFDECACQFNIEHKADQYCSSQLMRGEFHEEWGLERKPEARWDSLGGIIGGSIHAAGSPCA